MLNVPVSGRAFGKISQNHTALKAKGRQIASIRAYGYDVVIDPDHETEYGNRDKTLLLFNAETVPHFERAKTLFPNQGKAIRLLHGTLDETALWGMEIESRGTFFWQEGCRTLYCFHENDMNETHLHYWLLQAVLPLYFSLEEQTLFFHGAAVALKKSALAILGEPLSGKSTLLSVFIEHGYRFMADDRVGIVENGGMFSVLPAHPHLRRDRQPEELGEKTPEAFEDDTLPLEAIVLLKPNATVDMTALQGIEKFKALQQHEENSFEFLKDTQFTPLGLIAQTTPVWLLELPRNEKGFEEACRTILKYFGSRK